MIDLKGTSIDAEEREWLQSPSVCGVILFSRNFESLGQLEQLIAVIHEIREPPLLVAVDQEGGRVQRFGEPFTVLPPMRSLGRLYDRDMSRALGTAHAFGWLMAAELRAVEIDLSFAPVVDIDRGLAKVIGDRALHSSATAVSQLVSAFAVGVHEAGMAITAKHFPTHAGAINDTHTKTASDSREFSELWDDLQPYRHLISRKLDAVMVGHVSFPAIDPLPASFSSWWLNGQLRDELRFGGAIISDDISMTGATIVGNYADRVRRAIAAGCDMVLLCNASQEVPGVLDALEGYVNPPSQLHLMRLRGQQRQEWETLRSSEIWRDARLEVDHLSNIPQFEFEG
ncbi:MAG: beta-N-acetylhexosaminidase [Candidatus Rariloculaceae bacterium]